jgi:uncharacterized protein
MSRENVETLKAAYDAFNRGDWDSALSVFAPDAEWHEPDLPDAAVYRGHARIRKYWQSLESTVPGFRSRPERFVEAGDRVLVSAVVSGTGNQSGVDVAAQVGMIWTFRDGKVVQCLVRRQLKDALEAVGLSE